MSEYLTNSSREEFQFERSLFESYRHAYFFEPALIRAAVRKGISLAEFRLIKPREYPLSRGAWTRYRARKHIATGGTR